MTDEERLRALFNNLKSQVWEVNPQYKIEKEDAEVLLNATKELQRELFRVRVTEMHS